jgi:hypothetical protein
MAKPTSAWSHFQNIVNRIACKDRPHGNATLSAWALTFAFFHKLSHMSLNSHIYVYFSSRPNSRNEFARDSRWAVRSTDRNLLTMISRAETRRGSLMSSNRVRRASVGLPEPGLVSQSHRRELDVFDSLHLGLDFSRSDRFPGRTISGLLWVIRVCAGIVGTHPLTSFRVRPPGMIALQKSLSSNEGKALLPAGDDRVKIQRSLGLRRL